MKYKTIIFDLDGTLLDTLEDLCDSTNFALSQFGYSERKLSEVRAFVGNGIAKLIERALPNGLDNPDYNAVLNEFKAHYAYNCNNKTKAYSGIYDVLDTLKQHDIKMAVVSNKSDSAVKELCKQYFNEYFSIAVGERNGIQRKPAPDAVLAAMNALGAKKETTVYIGDSEVDVETARNAGIDLIAVSWGFRDRELLEKYGNFPIADSPEKIAHMILF
jgi:phosphoglycolate phosphatase